VGGKSHLKLNTGKRPIANKYCEGKMKSTLKRRLKELEIAEMEVIGPSTAQVTACSPGAGQHRLLLRESAQGKVAWARSGGYLRVTAPGSATRRRPREARSHTSIGDPFSLPRACTLRRR